MTCGLPVCFSAHGHCESCERRQRYGVIVLALALLRAVGPRDRKGDINLALDGLDALAGLMEDRKKLLRAHQRELREEIQGAQRDARESYREGVHDGQVGER